MAQQNRKRKIHGFTLADKTVKQLEMMAEEMEYSKSQIVELAIRRMFRKWEKQQKQQGADE